jgi:hypothetical protein
MTVNLSKAELTILNKVMGVVQDQANAGNTPPWVDDVVESNEFLTLNEKVAEWMADAK